MSRDEAGWASLLSMGAVSALLLVVGFAAGWFADRIFHTFPIFTLVGLALGVAWAGRYTYVEFRKFFKD